jgi:transcriptional regulator with XRE-family HTH domain
MFIGENIKILRKRKGKSQEEVATALGLNRSTYSGYENNIAQPNLENILQISKYYGLSIEELITKDFTNFKEVDWRIMTDRATQRMKGSELRILASIVSLTNDELIEVIPEKASAGYTAGFSDPEYFTDFPTLSLPFLSKHKKYRAFPVQGDSMPPVSQGSIVVGEYVQDWTSMKAGQQFILVTKSEGIVFKSIGLSLEKPGLLTLISSNLNYQPYEIPFSELLEAWKFVCYVSRELPEIVPDDQSLLHSIRTLQMDVKQLLHRK